MHAKLFYPQANSIGTNILLSGIKLIALPQYQKRITFTKELKKSDNYCKRKEILTWINVKERFCTLKIKVK